MKQTRRTFTFGCITVGALLGGYVAAGLWPVLGPLYGTLAGGLVGTLGVVAARHLGGEAVAGDGLAGGAKNLLTPRKPGEPPAPPEGQP